MRRKTVSVMMLTLLLTSMLTLTFKIGSVSALDYPAIYVDPPLIIDPTLTPGKNFTISIKTNYNGSDIIGWQFTLSFNPNVLHGVSVTNGDLTGELLFMPGDFDNTEGTLSLTMAAWIWQMSPPPLWSGPGTLANVTFTVVGYGCSNITLGPETMLIGYTVIAYEIIHAQDDPNNIGHGYFKNAEGGDVAVTDVMQWFRAIPVTDGAYSTWPINLNVTVENVGSMTVNCTVTVYYDSIPIATQNATDLVATEIRTLTLVGDITGLDPGKNPGVFYTLKANATIIALSDMNLANNEFAYGTVKVRRWGDVDNSDTISILDLKKVKVDYSNIIYEPFADLDGNDLVNILDQKKMKLIYSGILP